MIIKIIINIKKILTINLIILMRTNIKNNLIKIKLNKTYNYLTIKNKIIMI